MGLIVGGRMYIAQHSIDFLQTWEKDCEKSNFSLRFPMFTDFLTYLSVHVESVMFEKISENPNLMKQMRRLFYAQLRTYIEEMFLREGVEKVSA